MATKPYAGEQITDPVVSFTDGSTVDSDTVDLTNPAKGFHVNVSGTVKFITSGGETVELVVNAGNYYPYEVSRLFETGHTTLTSGDIFLAR